jgi:nitroreductase
MTQPPRHPEVLEFLLTRRSRPAKALTAPAPDQATLARLLTAAARCPDHGKLEPWRFVVIERPALERLARKAEAYARAACFDDEKIAKGAGQFARSPLCVAVISNPVEHPKIPQIEQILSAGGVCLGLVNAALAQGFGAAWLTGWPAHTRDFIAPALGLAAHESVAGFIHIGTCDASVPERPRPDVPSLTTVLSR